nr:hypothetical protein DA06_12015 [Georgenia sp. SUBG003]
MRSWSWTARSQGRPSCAISAASSAPADSAARSSRSRPGSVAVPTAASCRTHSARTSSGPTSGPTASSSVGSPASPGWWSHLPSGALAISEPAEATACRRMAWQRRRSWQRSTRTPARSRGG